MNRNTFHPSSRSARRHVLAAVAATVLGLGALHSTAALAQAPAHPAKEIGRASCRERVYGLV